MHSSFTDNVWLYVQNNFQSYIFLPWFYTREKKCIIYRATNSMYRESSIWTIERASNRRNNDDARNKRIYKPFYLHGLFFSIPLQTQYLHILCVLCCCCCCCKKKRTQTHVPHLQFCTAFFLSVSSLTRFITGFQVDSKQTCEEPIRLIQNAVIVDESILYSVFCFSYLSINARVWFEQISFRWKYGVYLNDHNVTVNATRCYQLINVINTSVTSVLSWK